MSTQANLAAQLEALRQSLVALTAQVAKVGVEELSVQRQRTRPDGASVAATAQTLTARSVVAGIDGAPSAGAAGLAAVIVKSR